jgi:hypothetical protein
MSVHLSSFPNFIVSSHSFPLFLSLSIKISHLSPFFRFCQVKPSTMYPHHPSSPSSAVVLPLSVVPPPLLEYQVSSSLLSDISLPFAAPSLPPDPTPALPPVNLSQLLNVPPQSTPHKSQSLPIENAFSAADITLTTNQDSSSNHDSQSAYMQNGVDLTSTATSSLASLPASQPSDQSYPSKSQPIQRSDSLQESMYRFYASQQSDLSTYSYYEPSPLKYALFKAQNSPKIVLPSSPMRSHLPTDDAVSTASKPNPSLLISGTPIEAPVAAQALEPVRFILFVFTTRTQKKINALVIANHIIPSLPLSIHRKPYSRSPLPTLFPTTSTYPPRTSWILRSNASSISYQKHSPRRRFRSWTIRERRDLPHSLASLRSRTRSPSSRFDILRQLSRLALQSIQE